MKKIINCLFAVFISMSLTSCAESADTSESENTADIEETEKVNENEPYAYEGYKDFIFGNYGIKVPEDWIEDGDHCYPPDEYALVYLTESEFSGFTDALVSESFEQLLASIDEDDLLENDIQVINDIKMWHASFIDTSQPYLLTFHLYHFIDSKTKKLIELGFLQDKNDSNSPDYSEEIEKILHSIHIVENPSDQSSANEKYKDFIVGNYGIKVPAYWIEDEEYCYSPDEYGLVYLTESENGGYADALASDDTEQLLAAFDEDDFIENEILVINDIKMWHVSYLDTSEPYQVTIHAYHFIDSKTKKMLELGFLQEGDDDYGHDYSKEYNKMLHSIHIVENPLD